MEYKQVSYNNKDYAVIRVNNTLGIIDFEDLDKINTYSKWYFTKVKPFIHTKVNNTILGMQSVILDQTTSETKALVDFINDIYTDYRKENIRSITGSEKNYKRSNFSRNITLPENCGFTAGEIPRHINYVKESTKVGDKHGAYFEIHIKGAKEFKFKTTKNKAVPLKDKLEQAKTKLKEIYNSEPELKFAFSEFIIQMKKDLKKSYNEILKLSGFSNELINSCIQE
jgi:hypothetical protein